MPLLPPRVTRLTLAGLAALAAAVVAGAQPPAPDPAQEPAQPPVFRAAVDLVRVDVSVSDGDGNPIEGLEAGDFIVEEDGVPQTVETVQFVRLTGQRTSELDESLAIRSSEHAAVEAARDDVRLFAIFLDDYHVDKAPVITLRLRPALVNFVKQFGPNDLVAVMDPLTPLSHLEFTRDQAKLIERMNAFEGRQGEYFPVRSAAEDAQMRSGNAAVARAGVTLSALEALVTHLGGLRETRASILFVSQGPLVNDPNSSNWHRLEDVLRAANRTNVTINVLDPRPLGGGLIGSIGLLRRLASETGGRPIVNSNDPSNGLTQVLGDASAYYLVGYTPTREVSADGRFHRIDVRVNRRGARVLARRGYWAPSEKELTAAAEITPVAPERTSALAALVEPASGRVVDVWMGTSPAGDGRTRVTVTWDLMVPTPEDPPASLEVEPIESHDGTALAAPATIATGAADAPTMAHFDLDPGTWSMRLTARDAEGATIDRWVQPLVVPDLVDQPLLISTPRFLRARSPFELRALRANPSPSPTASRRFRRTDRVLVDIGVVIAPGVPVDLVTELLNTEGKVLAPLPVSPPEDGLSRLELPLSSLAQGTYLLRIRAKAGEYEVQQHDAFRIVP
ncbi:MAG: VWA domain-containing protein [Vicinamibacterales bacterium]|nr:VWA domain-containing protein [Vicinamibacterales bacterium]